MVLLIAFIFASLPMGCDRQRYVDPLFPWPSSGVPHSDSLVVELEKAIAEPGDYQKLNTMLDSMKILAEVNPDKPLVRKRYELFKAYILFADGDTMNAMALYNKAIDHLDATKYPYDMAKWRQFFIMSSPLPYQRYEMAVTNYVYFSEIGDEYEKARAGIILGNIYRELKDTALAISYYRESQIPALRHNWENILWATNLNLSFSKDSLANDSLLKSILDMPMVRRSAGRATIVLVRLYENSGHIRWLDSALTLQKSMPVNHRITPTLLYLKGERLIQEQKFDSATIIFKEAAASMPRGYKSPDTTMIIYRRAEAYEYDHQLDSAVIGLQRAFQGLLTYYEQSRIPDVYLQETRMKIDFMRREEQLTSQRRSLVIGMIALTVVAIAALSVLYFRKKASEKKLKAEMYADKLRHSQEISQLRQLVIEEKNALISEVEKMVETERKDSINVEPLVAELSRTLSIHKGNEPDRANMVKIKEEVDSGIKDRLREEFPGLTKGDLKLVSMLLLGLDNHQIGRSMNISMESVWKARYRLRTRLGLSAETQLEDFLKDYARNGSPQ